ncbi:MAG: GGDEF domain-containing protein [Coriobacteriia bacterium]|nr:GGDEF domain-containing protein [Coriobacteriia bacterium]
MTIVQRIRSADRMTLVTLAARIAGCLVLLYLYAHVATHEASHANSVATGAGLFIISSLFLVPGLLGAYRVDLNRLLVFTLVADGIALGLLTSSLAQYEDPFYAWYMAEAAVAVLLVRRRSTWLLTAIIVVSYVVAQTFHQAPHSALLFGSLIVKTAVLVLVGVLIPYIVGGQEERQAGIEAQHDEVVRLNEKLERSVAELRAVTEITELIHSTLEIEPAGPVLLEILEKVISIPMASIQVVDKSKQETIFSASNLGSGAAVRSYSGLELAGAVSGGLSDSTLSCIELVDHGNTLVVFCADTEVVDSLDSDDRIVLQAVASELVVAVENSRLYRLTKRLAITDELTDLFNYRYLQQRLDDEVSRAERFGKRVSLLMLDIDDFKRVNDTYGHQVGDAVLAEVGQVLKSTVREVDLVARYGGEEFTVILPETDASGAFIVAEKIRESISLHRFPDADGARTIHLTVSIGLASYPAHAADKESLLRAADDAVYSVKETGKDRVRAPRLHLRRLPKDSDVLEVEGAAE